MKTAVCVLCIAVFSAISASADQVDGRYPRFIQFPDGYGNAQNVDLLQPVDRSVLNEVERNPADNDYLLFTRRNTRVPQPLRMNQASTIRLSYFNPRVPTVVIAHGWLSGPTTPINPTITAAVLNQANTNVIVLGWRRLATSSYTTAVSGVPAVGRGLGQFLAFLNSVTGAPFNTMHLVGFSLGAHLVGNAGRQLGGRLGRITGLDPAGPLWNLNSNRLRRTDAVYVEAIHTDGGPPGLGIGFPVADADFFPNGGIWQPGCLTSICNHMRAYQMFGSTVTRNHLVARQCANIAQITANTCRGSNLHMGNNIINKRGTGLFRVNTARAYPF